MRHVNAMRRLGKRIGANGPGITLAVIAILIAVTSVAFAAGGALTASQVKQVKSIIKKEASNLRGPQGGPGQTGPSGQKGDPGALGSPGKDGASIRVTPVVEGDPECAELGGAIVEKEGSNVPAEVCNGEKGAQGEPWMPNSTLPAGAVETGVWSFSASGGSTVFVPISFPIQLSAPLSETGVHYHADGDFETFCKGSAAAPKPEPGNLCVYEGNPGEGSLANATFKSINKVGGTEAGGAGANRTGAVVIFELSAADASGNGTFAVATPGP